EQPGQPAAPGALAAGRGRHARGRCVVARARRKPGALWARGGLARRRRRTPRSPLLVASLRGTAGRVGGPPWRAEEGRERRDRALPRQLVAQLLERPAASAARVGLGQQRA